jgi:hypothetical protein
MILLWWICFYFIEDFPSCQVTLRQYPKKEQQTDKKITKRRNPERISPFIIWMIV